MRRLLVLAALVAVVAAANGCVYRGHYDGYAGPSWYGGPRYYGGSHVVPNPYHYRVYGGHGGWGHRRGW